MNAPHSQVHFLSVPAPFGEKERLYLEVRRSEGRVLSDDAVRMLPYTAPTSPYAKEWRWRRRTLGRFLSYCKNLTDPEAENGMQTDIYNNSKPIRILDLGCGNGWMANRLAEQTDWEIWAVDVNETELEQGARLFGRANLRFLYADVLQDTLPEKHFDVAVLAASVQYFPDLPNLVSSLRKVLKTTGEIHFLDSPFYQNDTDRKAAKQRTLEYYSKTGVPEMAAFYHHHLWATVQSLGGVDMNNSLKTRVLQKTKWLAPFPWVKM